MAIQFTHEPSGPCHAHRPNLAARYNAAMGTPPNRIYLDHNATSAILPQAAEAIARVYASAAANPSSQHWAGRQARQMLEEARESIASIVGADCTSPRGDRLIFTAGGTEANNLAIFGLARSTPAHLVVSTIEHPSVAEPVDRLRRLGWHVDTIPVSRAGVADIDRLPQLLRDNTRLVNLMFANNETGVLQPVAQAAALCAARGIPLHTDAAQAVGRVPVDFSRAGVTAMSISAHKFHGPPGIGALVVRRDAPLAPYMHGGFQESGLRPGTEPVALAVGMRVALQHWHDNQAASTGQLIALRDEFESALMRGWPGLVINGHAAQRLPQTTSAAFPGLDRQAILMALDLAGIACSTGSACASGSSEPSSTLLAMGCPPEILGSSLRFSFGQQTSREDVLEAVRRILKICNELRAGKLGRKMPVDHRREGPILID
jgi:cysteine desulfurase